MTEDNTKDLSADEKLNLILAELSDLRAWRTKVDTFMEDRSRDTRPLLESLQAHVDRLGADIQEIKAVVKRLDSGFTQFSREVMDIKARQYDVEQRVNNLENRQ
jgi:uncharacterized protein (DUF3084 family)